MVSNGFTVPYADASFWIAHVRKETTPGAGDLMRWQITERILQAAQQGKYKLYSSAVTLAEVRRLQNRDITLATDELEQVRQFFQHEFIQLVDVTREIGEQAQRLGAQYGIRPIDAIHLASALAWECDVLLVWDKPFVTRVPSPINHLRISDLLSVMRSCEGWKGPT